MFKHSGDREIYWGHRRKRVRGTLTGRLARRCTEVGTEREGTAGTCGKVQGGKIIGMNRL